MPLQELRTEDPQQVGPYRLVGRLGKGSVGQVFLGRSRSGRQVAVKVISGDLADDPQFRARFAREVASARRVSGPFTVPIVDAGTDDPLPWLATEYVDGPSLDQVVSRQGPLPTQSVLTLAAGLGQALEAIHAAGLVHRDLKPSNVLLVGGEPRIIDFGIAHAPDLTDPDVVWGTPGFMSPEQAVGRRVGLESDIFSLGAVLAFAATGNGPFGAGTALAKLARLVGNTPDLDRVPTQIRPLIEALLAKDPAARPTLREILAAVEAIRLSTMASGLPKAAEAGSGPASDLPHAVGSTQLPARRPLPARRSLGHAFTDGLGRTFDVFGGTRRSNRRTSRRSTLAEDIHAICLVLGLVTEEENDGEQEPA